MKYNVKFILEQRKDKLDGRIQSYENKREERQKGIEFIRQDIELLKKTQYLELNASLYEAAAIIDDWLFEYVMHNTTPNEPAQKAA